MRLVSSCWVISWVGNILSGVFGITHLGVSLLQVTWHPPFSVSSLYLFIVFLLFLLLLPCAFLFLLKFLSIFFSFGHSIFYALNSTASLWPYYCIFSLHSHLLNHLVKFVSSENLLRVLTIFSNPKLINKRETNKMCNPKINSHHQSSSYFLRLVHLETESKRKVRLDFENHLGKHSLLNPSLIFTIEKLFIHKAKSD